MPLAIGLRRRKTATRDCVRWKALRPDVMVVDFAMPGLNGAEVAKAAWARLPKLPIVFASGYADTAAIEEVAGPTLGSAEAIPGR